MAKAKKAKKKTSALKKQASSKRQTKKVLAIPKGYNSITPYLIVDNATHAIDFYKKVFGATEKMRMGRPGGKIGHAELKFGDTKIMLADECPEMNARSPRSIGDSPVGIHLYVKNVDAVVDRAVSLGAKLTRPVENMFYGDRSGAIEDPFGHKWYVATHVENVSPMETKKRAAKLFPKE